MNLMKRLVNRAGFRFGIRPFPWADEFKLAVDGGDQGAVFDRIHQENYWGSDESISGGGSTKARTAAYSEALVELLEARAIGSIFDAPCGDLNWISDVIDRAKIEYIGGDISEVTLATARTRRPDLDLRLFNICTDSFPQVDLWHCRDCLFHLSFDDGLAALRNFARSTIPYALITTNSGAYVRNMDIVTGGHRVTDLQRAPYHLPRPEQRIADYPPGLEFPRYVALWKRESIAAAVL